MTTATDTLSLAQMKHRGGDLAGAAELYRQVVTTEPGHAQATALLALACHQGGNLSEAERWYRQAAALRPQDAELPFRLGLVLMSLARPDDAAEQFREAARIRPDLAEAWNNLGNVYFLQGKIPEAIDCYRATAKLRPLYAEACLNLGNALRENDEIAEGLTWYQEAVRLKPNYLKARNNLGAALLEQGQVEEAEAHFREYLRQRPGAPQVLCNLAANGLYSDADPRPDDLRVRLNDPQLSPMDRSQLHTALGFLLDRSGNHDEAFVHFREGNHLRRELSRQEGLTFDPAEHSRFIDRMIATFTPAYFDRVRGLGIDSEVPLFVVGMPRSGSSLVEQILSHHPEVAGAGELREIPKLVASLPERLGGKDPYPECARQLTGEAARQAAAAYLGRLEKLAGKAPRITDKMLENFLHLGLIATLFPRARAIHCIRDPLDVAVSCYQQIFRGLVYTRDLGDFGRYYKEYERLMAHWRSVLPLPVLDVVYEELVADVEGVSRRLVDFCGLPWDDRCLRFYENPRAVRTVSKLQVRRPVYASSIGRWRRYAAHLGPLRDALGLPPETGSATGCDKGMHS
jgi:tetratricopeptide (TPR) repeat protein